MYKVESRGEADLDPNARSWSDFRIRQNMVNVHGLHLASSVVQPLPFADYYKLVRGKSNTMIEATKSSV